MVNLSERLLKEKAKGSALEYIKKLNFWGHSLDDISILTTHCPNVEVLSLSVNDISSLEHFGALPNLRELYLRKNQIRDPHQTRYLSHSNNLRFLWLLENECANHPDYRSIVIANCPTLTKLDDQDVTPLERRRAVERMEAISNQNISNETNQEPPRSDPVNQHIPTPIPSPTVPTPSSTPTPSASFVPSILSQNLNQNLNQNQYQIQSQDQNQNQLRAPNVHQFQSADFPSSRNQRMQVHSENSAKEEVHPRTHLRPTKTESLNQGYGNTESSAVEYSYYSHNSKADLPQSTKENLLMAIFALLNELDSDGLVVVRKQLDKLSANSM